ncbi:MAG TPA: undecaprenyl-diphosphate phosphatase [Clostridia bacterium]|nr:undecaprenyl-diphosphate phosphatase [Clostridia bacterium]
MTFIQSILLGAMQGVTEFLPVSSSGHLVVFRRFMALEDVPMLFDVIMHVATLFVVLIVFRDRVGRLLLSLGRTLIFRRSEEDMENLRLFGVIMIATVLTGVLGLGIETLDPGANIKLVSLLFIVTGLILVWTRFQQGTVSYGTIGAKQGIYTGIAQGLGVFPGISRAGITISAALMSGMNREKAGEFSFLISIPAILGALLLKLKEADALFVSVAPVTVAVGFCSAFLVGLLSLLLLLKIVHRGKLYLFSFYLIPLGIIGLFFF